MLALWSKGKELCSCTLFTVRTHNRHVFLFMFRIKIILSSKKGLLGIVLKPYFNFGLNLSVVALKWVKSKCVWVWCVLQNMSECYSSVLTPQKCKTDMKSPHHIGTSMSVGKRKAHKDSEERFPPVLTWVLGRRGRDICLTDFWCFFADPSFIRSLTLSSVHLKNIKIWFMEMSETTPTLKNRMSHYNITVSSSY